jgi:amino acid adenylation domain-containing protein/thioester reductase-like protein
MRLFCLPHAGGSAAVYRGWGRALGPRFPVVPVELPGHGHRIREPLCTSAADLVERLLSELVDELGAAPFAIFGHSMGGQLAFHLAQELVRRDLPVPARLFISAARPPSRPVREPLHALPDVELLAALRRLNGVPDDVLADRAVLELLPIVRADLRLAETWSPAPFRALDTPVTLLSGRSDPLVPPEEMRRWREHFTGEVVTRDYPGDHFYPLTATDLLLRDVGDALSAATGAGYRSAGQQPSGYVRTCPIDPSERASFAVMNDPAHPAASFEQERVYVLDRLTAGAGVPPLHRALLLSGALSVEGVRQALRQVAARHEILRTSLSDASGRLVQVVHEPSEPAVTVVDLSTKDDPHRALRKLAQSFVGRPFDLTRGPLWRVLLAPLAVDRHALVLCMHPVVADAPTLMLMVGEILDLHAVATGGAAAQLAEVRQYRERAAEQRALGGEVLADQEAYWLGELAGDLSPAQLPTFRPRPAAQTFRCGWHRRVLPDDLVAKARRLAAGAGCALPAVLTAVFAALLHRYGARSEVVFGHALSTRRHRPGEAALGPFGNLAVMRLALTEETGFEELLRGTADRLARAEANRDLPFQRLARALDVAWDPSTMPLFQLLFESELEVGSVADLSRPGEIDVDDVEVPPSYAGYDVHVSARRVGHGIAVDWAFAADLFEPELIAQVADHFVRLLGAALADPAMPVARLPLLSDADTDRIRQRWNLVRTPYRRCGIHRLVEEQVARTPDLIAVEHGELSLSYTDLNRRANRLARHLRSLGASHADMVALCMDRSVDLIVAVVALLKAGCVVVPLDPAYPRERLAFMVEDAGVRTVVTTAALVARRPVLADLFAGLSRVDVDAQAAAVGDQAPHDLADGPGPDDAAYCIYTSGSTGRPKGAVVEHGALANLVAWHLSTWLADVGTRTLLYSPVSFDVSFHEILAGLCSGATLVQVDEATRINPMALLEFVRQTRVEKWYLPFVTLQQIAQAAQTAPPPADLKELIVGGEVLRITPEIRDFARRTGCVIHNHYGSTECIDVATHTLSGDPDHWPSVAPIGRANVHNMNMYILDAARQLAPIGVVGEIYGEGDCLARGYHGRPDLTDERFIDSPFGVQGARLYRMGDLGRYLPDGLIECLGRVDNQVKIRGFRVEPSEVEAVLAGEPAVAECLVAAKAPAHGRARLVAYVVPRAGHDRPGLPEELRGSLAERMPDHMVPTAVVVLDALPLTPSGKVDVRALPDSDVHARPDSVVDPRPDDPAGARPDGLAGARPLAAGVERAIGRIWSELLGLPGVTATKTFFELGGDSILLVRAHQRISQELDRQLPVDALFRYPTVGSLARFLARPERTAGTTPGGQPPGAQPPSGQASSAQPPGGQASGGQASGGQASGGQRVERPEPTAAADGDLAIVGMACRVPGARNLTEFWSNLRDGVESITALRDREVHRLDPDQTRDPHFVAAAAMLADVDLFDAAFFGYSPAEAAVIDPQQRLFLECAWEAVEDAALDTDGARVGVYAGSSLNTYLVNNVLPAKLGSRTFLSHRHFDEATELRIEQGNARDHLPTRVSFKLNLRGPSVNVQSTCSTSLVAVHLARQALLLGECDVALAGGVAVITPQNTGYLWRDGMMLAPDGHCRAFDERAEGTVFGNGLGVVVLKRLSAALADGDRIYAVVKGSAVNNDGALKMDYSGPSVQAQADVVAAAHRSAGVSGDDISYVEAHGTGTRLGDPIEIAGLTDAFGRTARRDGTYCAIGSVKTNVGHLDEAAGVVGLIKTALSLYHRQIPPSLHFTTPNPLAGLADSPFFVNARLRDWESPDGRPRRAGVSSFGMGGTNCHVVIEEPPAPRPVPPVPDRPAHLLPLSARSVQALRGVAERYLHRLEGPDVREFADICFSAATGRRHFDTRVAVLAPSAADARSQLAAMLAEPDLARVASRIGGSRPSVAFLFTGQGSQYAGMGRTLYETQPVFRAAIDHCDELLRPLIGRSLVAVLYGPEPDPSLDESGTAQPALFSIGYALHRLWESWGVRPDVLIGHSLGEYVAACVAGVFDLRDALALVAARGRLMQDLPRAGGMLQVSAAEDVVARHVSRFPGAVSIAAVNGPGSTVVAGAAEALDAIREGLAADGVEAIPLAVSHAFHSPLMEPMLQPFREVARSIRYRPPTVGIVSTVTGAAVRPGEMDSAEYWVRHVVEPVRFDRAMRFVHESKVPVFVELGAKPTLGGLGRQCLPASDARWLPSLTPRDPNAALASVRQLYLAGVSVDWSGFDAPFHRRRVPVPTYAFQRQRHWIEPDPSRGAATDVPDGPGGHATVPTFEVTWEPLPSVPPSVSPPNRYMIVAGRDGLATRLADRLRALGSPRVEVVTIDPAVGRVLPPAADGADSLQVVLVPDLSEVADAPGALMRLVSDARTILEYAVGSQAVRGLWILSRQTGLGGPASMAELAQAGAGALAGTINAEHPELDSVAVAVPAVPGTRDFDLLAGLIAGGAAGEERLAIHDGRVYRARIRPLPEPPGTAAPGLPIRPDGVYVITGGTGGLGLRLALAVADRRPRRLILVSRRGEPGPDARETWAALAATGTPVETVRADVTDRARMRQVLADCGPDLRGVFHCAGVLDDGILLRQTAEKASAVLRPKVAGGWLLHELTSDRELDFFVLFSSLASLLGYRGQGGYAVANEFLDHLARYRWRCGLPALSVSWGSWAGPGMTGRLTPQLRARMREEGEAAIRFDEGIAAMAGLMARGVPHAAAARMEWAGFTASRARTPSMVKALVADPEPVRDEPGERFADRLRRETPDEARRILRETVTAALRGLLDAGAADIDPTRGFQELGVDSLGALDLRGRLQDELGVRLPATLAFEHPSLDALVRHLAQRHFADDIDASVGGFVAPSLPRSTASPKAPSRRPSAIAAQRAIAIIGMSCRFPGAASPEEFWDLLAQGRDAVREIPEQRWDVSRLYDASPDTPGTMYVRRAALIDDVDCFDAGFFGISPREAASMDPRHRLLLESVWHAIEGAGIDPTSLRGTDTAVYLGGDEFTNDYLRQAASGMDSEPYLATGTTLSFTAGRLSYKLGLHGASMVIATACSSSLVALHSAVRAIRHGECGMAIVGGAKLMLAPEETIQLCKLRALAPDGVSKAFSADADGFGRGEGCAALLLKRLDRAVADGDPVLAVIRGTAVNHGGPSSGLTVPSGASQSRVISMALADAELDPRDVTYLEAHGTGTQLGDPIEVRALGEVFNGRPTPLLIGSVKANVGHLEEAAGLAGVVKVVLALRRGAVPPQIHSDVLTDKVDWASLRLAVQRTGIAWPAGAPRVAGVSSFGMSGTNAHVLLEAFTTAPARSTVRGPYVFPFSGRDEVDLAAGIRRIVAALSVDHDPAAIAYTLQTGRTRHGRRLAVVACDLADLRTRLEAVLSGTPDRSGVARGAAGGPAEGRVLAPDDVARLVERHGYADLAQAWCDGYVIEWRNLYAAAPPCRVPLPGYPFKRERLWIGEGTRPRVPAQRTPVPAVPTPPAPVATRPAAAPHADVVDALRAQVAELLGLAPQDVSPTALFDELGADSLTFMRVSRFVRDCFGVVISFQQLFDEAATLEELVAMVSSRITGSLRPSSASPAGAASPPSATPAAATPSVPAAPPAAPPPAAPPPAAPAPTVEREFRSGPSGLQRAPQVTERLTDQQAGFLAELIAAYAARTRASKEEAERDRSVMANCRMPPFQPRCKEMSYPIVVERSAGARFWDIDGNEYLDISMGYGVHLFGHQPPFVLDALRAQLDRGIHIGPQADRAGQVARLLCELTGMSRAVFCNSGTEAVMAALRFARAATGRTRFVMFEGSYHGWSDNTLALPAGPQNSIPMARGIGAGAMEDVVVLEYGAPGSVETIRALGPQLAAVLVEPVQSRRPDLQPTAFLRELRELTRESGTALIFDEVITGFRVHPGGAQVWSGVNADVVTYGKILGGGMPIGAVAGRAAFMDTVDGGAWRYGDDSRPTVPTTFFGGTFNKNPLSMASAHAVLTQLKADGPGLQRRLAENVAWLADDFNAFCRGEGFPLRIVHFSSLFRFIGEGEYSLHRFPLAIDLFFYLLALRGVYVLETRVCFLSTCHTPEDVRFISETAKSCLTTLRAGGFFPTAATSATVATSAISAPAAASAASRPGARLVEDARCDLAVAAPRPAPSGTCDSLLLTGATGFLGAHLVQELLTGTSARIHCLVRAADCEHAHRRVLDNLAANGCRHPAARNRIVAIAADLSRPRLGLDDRTWRQLAGELDAIYHNGAQVNSLLSYDRLRAANVTGTRELLRLAADGAATAFHYVSSDAVFDAYGYHRQATIYEDEPLAHADSLYGGGYAESKWVADKLVANCRDAGLYGSIYRPGMITGALRGGCGQLGDFFTRFVKGVIQLGICPELAGTIDFMPVDVVARTIVELSLAGGPSRSFHLTHPRPITYLEIIGTIRDAGHRLEVVPLHIWDAALAKLRYEDDNALYPLLPLFTETTDPVFRRSRMDTRNAGAARAFRDGCPPLIELMSVYLKRFEAEGYLPAPVIRPVGG